ncbi:MAG: hypothetical protein LBJ01_10020 [Tannerella sp.]|jgi:hypothetical protein|nr:hypothetical protein [Tannerella sp.]
MFTDKNRLPDGSFLQRLPTDFYGDVPFEGTFWYAALLERLGLKNVRKDGDWLLTPREGTHWMSPAEGDVAEIFRERMDRGEVTVPQLVSALTFVADKLDPEAKIPPCAVSWMCRDMVTRAVLQRFNEIIGCRCTSLAELSCRIGDNIAEANDVFRTIRFCCAATGSGYFPVALLNEMIAVKSQLGIWADREGNPLFQYKAVTDGRELAILDRKRFDAFRFRPSDPESRRIRAALLHEKRTFVASCLFGVEADPTAVSVCRLRLWTELLKHFCREANPSLDASIVACNIRCRPEVEAIEHRSASAQAVAWSREFPELWTGTGDFAGFDGLIGHFSHTRDLPFGQAACRDMQPNDTSCERAAEAFRLFCEWGNRLLRREGSLSCFMPAGWMKSVSYGQLPTAETNPLWMIEFDTTSPDEALFGKGIVTVRKERNQYRMMHCQVRDDFDPRKTALEDYLQQHATPFSAKGRGKAGSPAAFITPFDMGKSIRTKIEQIGTPLGSWDIRMYPGICSGYDEAFVIDGNLREEFIRLDYKNTDIIKPLLRGEDVRRFTPEKTDLWLICIPWHFPLLYDATIKEASERAEQRFRQQYPAIWEHLGNFREQLVNRDVNEVGVTFEWYALQRYSATGEWDDFLTQKIVWQRESAAADFCIDYRGCAILDTACFATGQHLKYLLGVLNSKPGRYLLLDLPHSTAGIPPVGPRILEALKVPVPNIRTESEVISWVNRRTSDAHQDESETIDRKIDELVYEIFRLDEEEKEFIELTVSNY